MYPTKEEVKKIANWDYEDNWHELLEYIKRLWRYPTYFRREKDIYRLSTGKWSGNESIINAMSSNVLFWNVCWVSSNRGGHHVFEIRKIEK